MEDIVYGLKRLKDGNVDRLLLFRDELPHEATFYTNMGEYQQKFMVDRKTYYITLHSSIFSSKKDRISELTDKQLKLFYNISNNSLK